MSGQEASFQWSRVTDIQCLYIVTRNGELIYSRSYDDSYSGDVNTLPTLIRNSVVLFQSSSSVSSERVYTLENGGNLWSYAFFQSFAIVTRSTDGAHIAPMKNMMLALGQSLVSQYGELIQSWSGSMSEIFDLDTLVDEYMALNLSTPDESLLESTCELIDSALERPEIAFIGLFDSNGKMLYGNIPEIHLFRLEVEISQGTVKPVIEIVPTSINLGDHKIQLFRVHFLTIAVAADPSESTMHAISVVGELAHALNELSTKWHYERQK